MPSSNNNVVARLRGTSGFLNQPHVDSLSYYQEADAAEKYQDGQKKNHHDPQQAACRREQHQSKQHSKQKYNKYNKYNKYKSSKKSKQNSQNGTSTPLDDLPDDDHVSLNKDGAALGAERNISKVYGQRKVSSWKCCGSTRSSLTAEQARNEHLIIPKGLTGPSAPGVKDRMKHPKLVGADVYVVRLTHPSHPPTSRKASRRQDPPQDTCVEDDQSDTCSTNSVTGSLHDELTCKGKGKGPESPNPVPEDTGNKTRVVTESRPCYRCVSYMHSVGIKRVFWTTSEGEWEGAKIRNLVDQLEGAMANTDPALGLPMFVTKHEVLLMRRLMLAAGENG